jgi:hypothetical protein
MASIISASTTSGTALNMSADTTGVLQFATGATPTTAVTIDTSQNVGIGTASPSYKLEIGTTSDSSISANIKTSTTGTGNLFFSDTNNGQGGITYNHTSDYMRFLVNDTERMRIDSAGNVLVGDTAMPAGISTGTKLYVKQTIADYTNVFINSNATAANCYGSFIKYTAASPNGTGNEFFAAVDSSVTRMTLRSNGGIANYSGNNVNLSDQREKTNIELAGSYLDKVCAIPVKTFNYIDQNMEEDGGLTLGVIAQDVQAVAPELVMESNWASKDEPEKLRLSIYQTDLQYALMKCIQEQQTLIVSQSELINSLTARVTALEAK